MDDFDGDGRLDLAVTCNDITQSMSYYHNAGDGRFEDRSESAGVANQLGGLVCYQADYNNDGHLDIFIPRGAWVPHAVRPTLLAEQRRRQLCRRHGESGLARPAQFQRGRLGRLRQRRLGRPVRRLRAPAQPAVSQSRQRHVRGSRRQGGRR